MAAFNHAIIPAALLVLSGCASAPPESSPVASAYAGKSVLDAAIAAAGGEAALAQVKEIEWTGTATINAGGKTTVKYNGDANIRGTIARVGARMIQPAARQIVGQFFGCLESKANAAK